MFDMMQAIRLSEVDENGHFGKYWAIKDIHKKDVELIAMTKYFGRPLLDKDGKTVRQVRGLVEAVPPFNDLNNMELYMKNQELPDDHIALPFPRDSYFVLKIDDGLWFNIKATYYEGKCGLVYLKSFEFDGREYVSNNQTTHIPLDEQKKRDQLKRDFPSGFPYKL